MEEDIEELEKDFKEMLACIDFKNYDPHSKLFMRALFIGQMYQAVKTLENSDEIEEELTGAEKYFDRYTATGDSTFKEMASDELRHAGILIKKHLAKTENEKKREKLSAYEKKRQEMLKEISMKE